MQSDTAVDGARINALMCTVINVCRRAKKVDMANNSKNTKPIKTVCLWCSSLAHLTSTIYSIKTSHKHHLLDQNISQAPSTRSKHLTSTIYSIKTSHKHHLLDQNISQAPSTRSKHLTSTIYSIKTSHKHHLLDQNISQAPSTRSKQNGELYQKMMALSGN